MIVGIYLLFVRKYVWLPLLIPVFGSISVCFRRFRRFLLDADSRLERTPPF